MLDGGTTGSIYIYLLWSFCIYARVAGGIGVGGLWRLLFGGCVRTEQLDVFHCGYWGINLYKVKLMHFDTNIMQVCGNLIISIAYLIRHIIPQINKNFSSVCSNIPKHKKKIITT